MKALVYCGPGLKAIEDRPKPQFKAPGDAIVKMVKTTICGTDLHILKGDVATCAPGRVLGPEGVRVVDSVGAGVTAFHPGDRVVISCISSPACCRARDGAFLLCPWWASQYRTTRLSGRGHAYGSEFECSKADRRKSFVIRKISAQSPLKSHDTPRDILRGAKRVTCA